MAEDQEKKEEEKFEFDSTGQALDYISLDQARVLAMRTARESPSSYGPRYLDVMMSFEVMTAEETEDYYIITLAVRPQESFAGSPGREQFFIEKEGSIEHRQVLRNPGRRIPSVPVAVALVMVSIVTVIVVAALVLSRGGDGGEPAPGTVPSGNPLIVPIATALPVSSEGARPEALLAAAGDLPFSPVWVPVGDMSSPRSGHAVAVLDDGKVLVSGGFGRSAGSAEVFDPVTQKFSPTGNLVKSRAQHSATLLKDGRVLIVGSCSTQTAEVYDPSSGTFSKIGGERSVARSRHTATRLADGKVLIAGGACGSGSIKTAEIFDPATGTFSATAGTMATPRHAHRAILLPNGEVLLVGGVVGQPGGSVSCPQAAELYDPSTNRFRQTGDRAHRFACDELNLNMEASLLANQKVLVAAKSEELELYDPSLETFGLGAKVQIRFAGTATLLPGGLVLLAGGRRSAGGSVLDTAQLYDPIQDVVVAAITLNTPRYGHTATPLPNGDVLFIGGRTSQADLATAELFVSSTGTAESN